MPAAAATPRKTVTSKPEKKRRKVTRKSTLDVGQANTKGFPTLPVELHLEILSYFPSVPIPCPTTGILREGYRDRFDAIFALSQTCSALYHVYHPMLYKSLEVCATRYKSDSRRTLAKEMATELVFQIEVVTIRAPHLAEFVQVFNVALTAFSSPTVYEEFARCLHCLPNLHTLQIISFPDPSEDLGPQKHLRSLEHAFTQALLPSVETLTLPVELLKPIRLEATFPNLRHLAILDWTEYNDDILKLIPQSIHSLYGHPSVCNLILHTIQPYSDALEPFFERFPHLRITPRMHFRHSRSTETVRELVRASLLRWTHKCPELHTIQLLETEGYSNESIDTVVDIAKDVLLDHLRAHENIVEGKIIRWRMPVSSCSSATSGLRFFTGVLRNEELIGINQCITKVRLPS